MAALWGFRIGRITQTYLLTPSDSSGLSLRGKLTSPLSGVGFCVKKRCVCREARADIRPRIRQPVVHVDVEQPIVPTVIRVAATVHDTSARKNDTKRRFLFSFSSGLRAEKPPWERHFQPFSFSFSFSVGGGRAFVPNVLDVMRPPSDRLHYAACVCSTAARRAPIFAPAIDNPWYT